MKNVFESDCRGNTEDALDVEVAWFRHMKSTRPEKRRLGEILEDIRNERWGSEIARLRSIFECKGEKAYNYEKISLPSFYASGCASSPKSMNSHSGFVQVDLDKLGSKLPILRANLLNDPHIVSYFISPGGKGIKVIFRIYPLDAPLDGVEHKRAIAAVSDYFHESYGVTCDPSCANVNRHCLVSSDTALHVNANATPFPWREAVQPQRRQRGREGESLSKKPSFLHTYDTSVLPSYHTTPQPSYDMCALEVERRVEALRFRQDAECNTPQLWALYERLLERRHEARGGERNRTIIAAVPFLYRALSNDLVRLFMSWFYQCNAHIFKDPLDCHLREVDAMLKTVEESYQNELSPTELAFWITMKQRNREAFRICRDLALHVGKGAPPAPLFYLSNGALAERLGCSRASGKPQDEIGGRLLRSFVDCEVIGVDCPGVRRGGGTVGRAAIYRWLLPTNVEGIGKDA